MSESPPPAPAPPPQRLERVVVLFALVLNAARVAIMPAFELFPQETYYDLYARHLALSYFDHPPLIAWALRAFEAVFGHHAVVLRLCAFTLTAVTQLLFWRLVREVVPAEEDGRRAAALTWLCLPAVSIVALIASPDVPLLLFWTAALLAIWRALDGRPNAWLWAGLWMGLAFDGKYTAVFLPLGVCLLLLRAEHRGAWRRWQLWGGVLLGLTVTTPVFWWNATHALASFRFQTVDRVAAGSGLQLRFFLGLLGSQLVLVGPVLLVLASSWRASADRAGRFFWTFSMPALAVCLALSLLGQVKPNWLEPFYVAGLPLVALRVRRLRPFIWITVGWSLAVHALAAVELLVAPVAIASDDTFVGWSALSKAVAPRRTPDIFVFSTDGYKTSAELWFYGGERTYSGEVVGRPGLQFEYFDRPCPMEPNALYVQSALHGAQLPVDVASHFADAQPLPDVDASGRWFHLWRLNGYRRDVRVCSAIPLDPNESHGGLSP